MFVFAKKLHPTSARHAKKALAACLSGPALALALLSAPSLAQAKESISVHMNMARILRLGSPAATIIVGNPGIADVTIQDPQTLVLTGKSFGRTNLIALDKAGNPIADTVIVVSRGTTDIVTVYMGSSRTSFACAPECQPTIQVGDDTDFTNDAVSSSAIVESRALPR